MEDSKCPLMGHTSLKLFRNLIIGHYPVPKPGSMKYGCSIGSNGKWDN